jgi:hypothetical protein
MEDETAIILELLADKPALGGGSPRFLWNTQNSSSVIISPTFNHDLSFRTRGE